MTADAIIGQAFCIYLILGVAISILFIDIVADGLNSGAINLKDFAHDVFRVFLDLPLWVRIIFGVFSIHTLICYLIAILMAEIMDSF